MNKVILISIDGMRPDGVLNCGNPYVQELMKIGSHALDARTVMPHRDVGFLGQGFHGRRDRHIPELGNIGFREAGLGKGVLYLKVTHGTAAQHQGSGKGHKQAANFHIIPP